MTAEAPGLAPGEPPDVQPLGARLKGWLYELRKPAAELFEFEVERGRVRLGGLRPFARWLSVLGLSTIGLLLVSIIVLSALAHGQSETVQATSTRISVRNGTVAATLVFLSMAWELVVYAASRSARAGRVLGGVLFFLANGVLVSNLPDIADNSATVAALYDLARVSLVAVPAALLLLALTPGSGPGAPLRRTSLAALPLRAAACIFTLVLFASLLAAERVGRGSLGVRVELAAGVIQELATLVLLLAPLLYLSGMAVLSLTYGIGTAAALVLNGGRRIFAWLIVIGLIAGEAWFFGWRDRAELWPGPHGWVVLLHVGPVIAGFGVIAYLGRKVLRSQAEAVRDSASATVAFLAAVPSIVAGLYFALYSVSTLGFIHVPDGASRGLYSSVDNVLSATVSTGPRCVLFGIVAAAAIGVLRHPQASRRQQQFAMGLALMSGWIFWTLFVDWLPGSDTADGSLFSLVALALLTGYLATKWRGHREVDLARAAGALIVIWLFDADAGFLRSLSHLVPVEGAIVLVAGVLLVLFGKSQFTDGTSPRLPREARVAAWTGYIVLSLSVAYWERGVQGFADLTAHNAEFSVLSFVAVPYIVWLTMSGRFSARPLAPVASQSETAAGSAGGERELEELSAHTEQASDGRRLTGTPAPGTRRATRWRPLAATLASAGLLTGGAAAIYRVDKAGIPQPVTIARGVGILVPSHWSLTRRGPLAVVTHERPAVIVVVLVGTTPARSPLTVLATFIAGQSFLSKVQPKDLTSFPLGPGGNFSVIALAKFNAFYTGQPVTGQAFALLNTTTGIAAYGAAFASGKRDFSSVAAQIGSMEQSLNTLGSGPLW